MGVGADQQLGGVLATRGNFLDFTKEHLQINHYPVADNRSYSLS